MSSANYFDDLAPRFQRNIYNSLKGRIRLDVLRRDFREYLPVIFDSNKPINILDAGSGQGQFAIELARFGHRVTLVDVSEKMLAYARDALKNEALEVGKRVNIIHSSVEDISFQANNQYDLVLCHALLEWSDEPEQILSYLVSALKPQGFLSLIFYNLNGMIYKNLLRTNYKKIQEEDYQRYRGSLTPTNPLKPEKVFAWLSNHNLDILCHSGIRVFHDYILSPEDRGRDPNITCEMELRFSRMDPYRGLGRYQHILSRLP